MKRWTQYVLALALVLITQQAMAQFNAILIHAEPSAALTTTCGGATPIPDGTIVKIFWDTDSDGPDNEDPQPILCTNPPDCNDPFNSVNFIEFEMNGVFQGLGAGFFLTDPAFSCTGTIPTPNRYYLRIYEPDNTTVLWTSTIFSVVVGLQEIYFTDLDWTCGSVGPQCTVLDESE